MRALAAFLALASLLAAASGAGAGQGVPPELAELREGRSGEGAPGSGAGPLRERAQKELALSSGVQAGARWRYQRILDEIVLPREGLLDDLFDFGPLVTVKDGLVLIPPAAVQAGPALRLSGDREASGQDGSYRLLSPARLSSVKPDWRHYLMRPPKGPGPVPGPLAPSGAAEASGWRREVDRGWRLGLAQGDRLFAANVAALGRDYLGLLIYRRLTAEKLARPAGTFETVTDLEASPTELVFRKTLYRLVGGDGFAPAGRTGKTPGEGGGESEDDSSGD
jgi:defect-in-organelle-trafficking protein DotC